MIKAAMDPEYWRNNKNDIRRIVTTLEERYETHDKVEKELAKLAMLHENTKELHAEVCRELHDRTVSGEDATRILIDIGRQTKGTKAYILSRVMENLASEENATVHKENLLLALVRNWAGGMEDCQNRKTYIQIKELLESITEEGIHSETKSSKCSMALVASSKTSIPPRTFAAVKEDIRNELTHGEALTLLLSRNSRYQIKALAAAHRAASNLREWLQKESLFTLAPKIEWERLWPETGGYAAERSLLKIVPINERLKKIEDKLMVNTSEEKIAKKQRGSICFECETPIIGSHDTRNSRVLHKNGCYTWCATCTIVGFVCTKCDTPGNFHNRNKCRKCHWEYRNYEDATMRNVATRVISNLSSASSTTRTESEENQLAVEIHKAALETTENFQVMGESMKKKTYELASHQLAIQSEVEKLIAQMIVTARDCKKDIPEELMIRLQTAMCEPRTLPKTIQDLFVLLEK